jgi:hypothetical protein
MGLISKGAVILGMAVLLTPLALPAQAVEPNPSPLIAQNNPFNNVDDGVLPLIVDTMRMMESAKKAMNSSDPEVKRMAQESYNMAVQNLNGLMTMWMKKNPSRINSPTR